MKLRSKLGVGLLLLASVALAIVPAVSAQAASKQVAVYSYTEYSKQTLLTIIDHFPTVPEAAALVTCDVTVHIQADEILSGIPPQQLTPPLSNYGVTRGEAQTSTVKGTKECVTPTPTPTPTETSTPTPTPTPTQTSTPGPTPTPTPTGGTKHSQNRHADCGGPGQLACTGLPEENARMGLSIAGTVLTLGTLGVLIRRRWNKLHP